MLATCPIARVMVLTLRPEAVRWVYRVAFALPVSVAVTQLEVGLRLRAFVRLSVEPCLDRLSDLIHRDGKQHPRMSKLLSGSPPVRSHRGVSMPEVLVEATYHSPVPHPVSSTAFNGEAALDEEMDLAACSLCKSTAMPNAVINSSRTDVCALQVAA